MQNVLRFVFFQPKNRTHVHTIGVTYNIRQCRLFTAFSAISLPLLQSMAFPDVPQNHYTILTAL